METIKEIKKQLGITNKDIAKMFGYKNLSSYANASRKKHIENGIVEIFKKGFEVYTVIEEMK